MACFVPPLLGNGERLFEQGASIQALVGPFTVRPDGIKDDHAAKQYIGQVTGIIRMVETFPVGKALVNSIRSFKRPVLIFPLLQLDDDDGGTAFAWVDRRMGMFPVVMSYTPLFGQRLRQFLGADEQDFDRVFTPHEVIVHELTHVARAVSGNFGKLDDDEEELATLVANMFSLEIGKPLVHSYNDDSSVTGDPAAFSRSYYKDNFEWIEAFCKQSRDLAVELSHVNTTFNPLHIYIEENT